MQIGLGKNMSEVLTDPPAGEYRVKVVDGEETVSAQKQTPGIRWRLEIQDGDFAGRTLLYTTWTSEPALPILKRFLAACGVDVEGDSLDTDDVMNAELNVITELNDNGFTEVRRCFKAA